VVDALVTNFYLFSVLRELHNDQGQFIQEVLGRLWISKTQITPLHLQSDGIV
jgi:hypothetical protein